MRPDQTVPPRPTRVTSLPRLTSSDILDPLDAMRQELERRMLRGEHFTDVEDRIDSTDFSSDEKAALWLLAWSFVHPRVQRREATAHLAALTAATPRRTASSRRRLRIVR
jgi:alkylhydroperoxidase family enzyme